MSRTFGTIIGSYLAIGVIRTVVVEVYNYLQGSSTIGILTSGAPPSVKVTAVFQAWLMPIVTWPLEAVQLALRQLM